MYGYSSLMSVIRFLLQTAFKKANFVSDMDGTFGISFDVFHIDNPNVPIKVRIRDLGLTVKELFDPELRDSHGFLHHGQHLISPAQYFASDKEPMNVYVHPALAEQMILSVVNDMPELFIVNTGRGWLELEEILLQSGIPQQVIDMMYSVTSHGTELRLGYLQPIILVQRLTRSDKAFLNSLYELGNDANSQLGIALRAAATQGLIAIGLADDISSYISQFLTFKLKEKGAEVGYRSLVEEAVKYTNVPESEIDLSIVSALSEVLQNVVGDYESQFTDANRVKLGIAEENRALEVRQMGVNKARGMQGLFTELLNRRIIQHNQTIVFGADSMMKQSGQTYTERTDYSAAAMLKVGTLDDLKQYRIGSLAESNDLKTAYDLGVNGQVVYVQHPLEQTILPASAKGLVPTPGFSFPPDHPLHPSNEETGVSLVMWSPKQYSDMIAFALSLRLGTFWKPSNLLRFAKFLVSNR